jgi:hypothetical protein
MRVGTSQPLGFGHGNPRRAAYRRVAAVPQVASLWRKTRGRRVYPWQVALPRDSRFRMRRPWQLPTPSGSQTASNKRSDNTDDRGWSPAWRAAIEQTATRVLSLRSVASGYPQRPVGFWGRRRAKKGPGETRTGLVPVGQGAVWQGAHKPRRDGRDGRDGGSANSRRQSRGRYCRGSLHRDNPQPPVALGFFPSSQRREERRPTRPLCACTLGYPLSARWCGPYEKPLGLPRRGGTAHSAVAVPLASHPSLLWSRVAYPNKAKKTLGCHRSQRGSQKPAR